MEPQDQTSICIVFPHVEKFAQWEELRYALRSIHKNYKGQVHIVIVGDKPKWLNTKALYIKVPCTGKSPRLDVIQKKLAVIEHTKVPEEFFWSNDDIYFVNKVTYHDLCIPKIMGADLRQKVSRLVGKSVYHDDLKATYNELVSRRMPLRNYSTHLPYRYEKTKLKALIKDFNLETVRLLPENIYFNTYYADELPYVLSLEESNCIAFAINRKDPNWSAVNDQLRTKKFFNHSEAGMTPKVQQMLKNMFPEPSPWEK